MKVVTPTAMRQRLGEILDAASAGERFLIERDHKPLAFLVSIEDGRRLDETKEQLRERRLTALERLRSLARQNAIQHPLHAGHPSVADTVRMDRDRDDVGPP
jgi:prevent-host-death family protein